jgi:hypothetical protein
MFRSFYIRETSAISTGSEVEPNPEGGWNRQRRVKRFCSERTQGQLLQSYFLSFACYSKRANFPAASLPNVEIQSNSPFTLQTVRFCATAYVVWWSEFLATDPEARVRIPALPDILGLERGPPSLVSTTEELLDRKVAAPV